MNIELSDFGKTVTMPSGLTDLMEDLGNALECSAGKRIFFFGGGNPAAIPDVNAIWRREFETIMQTPGDMESLLGNYADPRGSRAFLDTVVAVFNERYGWGITRKNVCVTHGGQAAFFALFNCLAGRFDDGARRKEILIPVAPEYIGYASQSVSGPIFRAKQPAIELIGAHEFKYRVDFGNLDIHPETAALVVSRPTNPTGNVLTDDEIYQLADLAETHGIPLIVDNAYGAPFPSMIFTQANTIWKPNMVLTMSLSKIGLPGVRTALMIGPEDIISATVALTTISGLNNNNVGQRIVEPLLRSGELFTISEEMVRPYYYNKAQFALQTLHDVFGDDVPWRVHKTEGALFLWLWFEGLPIDSHELYERLVARNVFVLYGNGFFFGLEEQEQPWQHINECIRISYAQEEDIVREGFAILAEEVKKAYCGQ